MFAYCGNNPVSYSDQTGNAYNGINSQFNYCEYEHTYGGLRENFYTLPDVNYLDYGIVSDVIDVSVAYYFEKKIPLYDSADTFISFYGTYDLCRFSGLDYGPSFAGAIFFTFVPSIPASFLGDSLIVANSSAIASDCLLDIYIAYHQPSPVIAAQNSSNHIAQRYAAVCIAGSMRYITYNELGARNFIC